MVLRRTVSIKRLGGDEAGEKAFGRFLRNKRVSEAALITAAKSHLLAQVAGRRVLAIQDTSEINFSRHTRSKTAFGRGGNGTDAAFFVHPVLAVDADSNVILGLADVQLWQRHGTAAKGRPARRMRKIPPLAGWCRGGGKPARGRVHSRYRSGRPRGRPLSRFCAAAGRSRTAGPRPDRARVGRWRLSVAHLDGLPIADRFILDLPAIPGRSARRAAMVLRYGPVSLSRPRNSADRNLPATVALYALDVREIEAPAGVEPVHWRLLSSAPIDTVATAHQAIADYRRRWHIEQLFRTLKSQGLDLEDSQIKTPHVLHKIAVVALRAAVVCMQLVHARGGADQRPAIAAFETEEVEVLKPSPPPSTARPTALKIPSRRDRCLGRLGLSLASAHGAVPRAPNHPAP